MYEQFYNNKSVSRLFKLVLSLLTGLGLLGLGWSLSPATTVLSQASNHLPSPATTLQASTHIKLYLPIIVRNLPTFEEQLLSLINIERKARGQSALSAISTLTQIAEAHSQDMLNRDFFDHINPDGLGPGDRLNNAGYKWNRWGEVIGAGYSTPQAMLNGWMNSPGHRANLLNPDFTQMGLGHVAGGAYGHYWTAILARPQ